MEHNGQPKLIKLMIKSSMRLTYDDLQAMRKIVEETVSPIKGELEALRNDFKEIYEILADHEKNTDKSGPFQKMSLEKKILYLHADLVEAAKQAGVTLPTHQ